MSFFDWLSYWKLAIEKSVESTWSIAADKPLLAFVFVAIIYVATAFREGGMKELKRTSLDAWKRTGKYILLAAAAVFVWVLFLVTPARISTEEKKQNSMLMSDLSTLRGDLVNANTEIDRLRALTPPVVKIESKSRVDFDEEVGRFRLEVFNSGLVDLKDIRIRTHCIIASYADGLVLKLPNSISLKEYLISSLPSEKRESFTVDCSNVLRQMNTVITDPSGPGGLKGNASCPPILQGCGRRRISDARFYLISEPGTTLFDERHVPGNLNDQRINSNGCYATTLRR